MNPPRIHPTARIEDGVTIGEGTSVWDHVHIRGPSTRIGARCIIGEKTYIAYGVDIGNLVKINAFVYVCTAVTLERGVMIAAHTVFTNDRFPRAATPDLTEPWTSDADEHTEHTTVREGATLGARCTVGPGLTIGRFAMVGMASVLTRSVPDFHLVLGSPARSVGLVCRCGQPIHKGDPSKLMSQMQTCAACGRAYHIHLGNVTEAHSTFTRVAP